MSSCPFLSSAGGGRLPRARPGLRSRQPAHRTLQRMGQGDRGHRLRARSGGQRDRRLADQRGTHGRGHHCPVEGLAERGLGRPTGAYRYAESDAGGQSRVAQVLPRLQGRVYSDFLTT